MTHGKFVYVCGECFDCAIVMSQEGRFDRGIPCPNCDNTIWFDETDPDIRAGEIDCQEDYGVSEVWDRLREEKIA